MIGECALMFMMFKENPKTALFNIISAGTLVQLKSFVKNNAVDLNCKNDDGYTPLMLAAANEDKDKAEYLLQKGAVPDIPNKFGASPLCYAAMYGKYDLCKLLISFGASINHQDTTGTSPLMTASCLVDNKILVGHGGSHSVLIIGFESNQLVLHSPGHPKGEYCKFGFDFFNKAWASPNDKMKNIAAFKLRL